MKIRKCYTKHCILFLLINFSVNLFLYNNIYSKNEIQVVFPADMQFINDVKVEFQWIPLKENDIKYKINIVRIVDTGIGIKNYQNLKDAPKTYFYKHTKLFTDSATMNKYVIKDISLLFKSISAKEKTESKNQSLGVLNTPENPMNFYAWQVEAYRDKKLTGSSGINIFLWNSISSPPEVITTELLEPKDGAVVNPEKVNFCWKGSTDKELQYSINYVYESLNTNISTVQPGPFDYLTMTQEQKTLDSLIFIIDSVEIPFWEYLSKKLEENTGNIKTYENKFSALSSKLQKRAKAQGINLTETTCNMPDSCESEPVCGKLKSTEYYHREVFKQRYQCLINKIHSQNISMQNLITEYSRLQRLWNTIENRSTDFGIYDDFVNFVSILSDGKLNDIEQDALPKAYSITSCLSKSQNELQTLTRCTDFIKNSVIELKAESNKYKEDIIKLHSDIAAKWVKDSNNIESNISLAVWDAVALLKNKKECCPSDTGVIELNFPPYKDLNQCYSIFYSALSRYIGDYICWLNVKIKYDCKTNNVSWLWKGPEKKRLTGCFPKFEQKENLGIVNEDGSGKNKCFPTNDTERKLIVDMFTKHPNGKWEIEIQKNGMPVSGIAGREIITKPLPKNSFPITVEQKPKPVKSCNSTMRLLLNRIGVPPLNQKRTVNMGDSAEIAIDGNCDGDCFTLEKIMRINNPDVYYGDVKFPVPPVIAYSDAIKYDFPYCGKYTIYGVIQCSDSAASSDKFYAEVNCTLTNQQQSSEENLRAAPDCPSCGCINLFYMNDDVKTNIINNFLYLGKTQKVEFIYESHCFGSCSADKEIVWQITDPDGKKTIKNGKNLTELKYNFTKKGRYKICITEHTICGAETKDCSIFLTVDTGQ